MRLCRLLQMTVTALLANNSLTLATRAAADTSTQEGIRKVWLVFAVVSFVCSIVQLSIGALIGVLTVGRTPRTFIHFLLWGEFLVLSTLTCFVGALLSLLISYLFYVYALTADMFNPSSRIAMVGVIAATCMLALTIGLSAAYRQWVYEYIGRTVPTSALRCLCGFGAYDYSWHENKNVRKESLKAVESSNWDLLNTYIEIHTRVYRRTPTFKSIMVTFLLPLFSGPLCLLSGWKVLLWHKTYADWGKPLAEPPGFLSLPGFLPRA